MELHHVQQGSEAWHALRAQYFTASEAPAMMGASKYQTRDDLLKQKATGIVSEVDPGQQRRFDSGHDTEAKFRPIAEELIGDELYPCTGSRMVNGLALLASFDGLTMDRNTVFEHKLYRDDLAKHLDIAEEPPAAYYWQLEQQLLVSNAQRALFVTSNGTAEQHAYCWYVSKPERRAQLIAGWKQFAIDLAAYVPTESFAPVVAAAPVEALPAVLMTVSGTVTVADNFKVFKQRLDDFLENHLIRKPSTDQDFADLDLQIKAMKDAREKLQAGKALMLAQVQPIDQANKTADMLDALLQQNCAMAERLLKDEKERRRGEIVATGVSALRDHIAGLNKRLGKPFMPGLAPAFTDFGGAIKGKKNLDSMQGAVNDLLAKAKIEANAIADRIDANLRKLAETPDLAFLFSDVAQIVLKQADDFEALVQFRVADHRAKEAAKLEAIRKEEQAKAEKAARDKLAAEQAAAEQQAKNEAFLAGAERREQARQAEMAEAVLLTRRAEPAEAINVVPLRAAPVPAATPPSLTLGAIHKRLAPITITADGLASLGFTHSATNGMAKLFHEHQFPDICAALVRHLEAVQAKQAA